MVSEIIALSGFARSGKDEAASVLVKEYGFIQVAFADKLREMIYALNPVVDFQRGYAEHPLTKRIEGSLYAPVFLQNVIDNHGWDGYKDTEYGKEIRRLLQRLGTEAGRETLWDSIWIDAALTGLPEDAKVVVSDARFFNEFDAVRERGGYVWRIDRPGVGPANDHASEMEATTYEHFSISLSNSGTLEEWHDSIRGVYESGAYKPAPEPAPETEPVDEEPILDESE